VVVTHHRRRKRALNSSRFPLAEARELYSQTILLNCTDPIPSYLTFSSKFAPPSVTSKTASPPPVNPAAAIYLQSSLNIIPWICCKPVYTWLTTRSRGDVAKTAIVSPRGSSCVMSGGTLRFEAYRYSVKLSAPVLLYVFALGGRGDISSAERYAAPAGASVGKVETFPMRAGKSLPGSGGIICCVIVFVSSCRVYSVPPRRSH